MKWILIFLSFLSACSLIQGDPIQSSNINLDNTIAVSENVYRLKDKALFLMSMEDCRKTGTNKLESNARELLVGFKDIKILKQELFLFNDVEVQASSASASLDGENLIINYYTFHDKCLRDIVFWYNANEYVDPLLIENLFREVINNASA